MNLATILEMSAAAVPDRPAVTFQDETRTYLELLELAARWADMLDASGSERVAVIGENHLGLLGLVLGASLCGRDVALMNPRLKAHELAHALRTTEATTLYTCGVRSDAPGAALAELDFPVDRVEIGAVALPAVARPRDATEAREGAALQIFTSGTTSLPKAVVLGQDLLVQYLLGSYEPLSAAEREATLLAVPLFHIAGVMNAMSAIYSTRRLVLMPRFDAEAWLRTAQRERVTQSFLVPTMLRQIVAALRERPELRPAELRLLAYGGSPAAPCDIRAALGALPDVDFVGAFGLTETSSTIALLGPDDHRSALAGDDAGVLASVGRPIPGVEIAIAESEGDRPHTEPARRGEIVVRGPQVSGRYLGGVSRVDADGWFHTGDLGYFDRDGYLYIAGRADDMIQRGAENISPREVELAFERQPDVVEAAAIGLPDEQWGEVVALVVVGREGASLGEAELRGVAEEQLAAFKRPARYVQVAALPRNALGKLLRPQLKAALLAQEEAGEEAVGVAAGEPRSISA